MLGQVSFDQIDVWYWVHLSVFSFRVDTLDRKWDTWWSRYTLNLSVTQRVFESLFFVDRWVVVWLLFVIMDE